MGDQTIWIHCSEKNGSTVVVLAQRAITMKSKMSILILLSLAFSQAGFAQVDEDRMTRNSSVFKKADLKNADPASLALLGTSMGEVKDEAGHVIKGGHEPTIVKDAPAIPVYWAAEIPKFGSFGAASNATGDFHKAKVLGGLTDVTKEANKYLATNPESILYVFIHGCCQDFPNAFSGAAELARATGQPVLLYSWNATPYKVTGPLTAFASHGGYSLNEASCASGATKFGDFLTEFAKQVSDPSRVVLVAHSMGNRLMDSELEFRYRLEHKDPNAKKYRAVVFACADVPVEAFAAHKDRIAFNAKKVWVLANNKDKALFGSSKVHDGFRLGAPQDKLDSIIVSGVSVADIESLRGTEHAMPCEIIASIIQPNKYKSFKLMPVKSSVYKVVKAAK